MNSVQQKNIVVGDFMPAAKLQAAIRRWARIAVPVVLALVVTGGVYAIATKSSNGLKTTPVNGKPLSSTQAAAPSAPAANGVQKPAASSSAANPSGAQSGSSATSSSPTSSATANTISHLPNRPFSSSSPWNTPIPASASWSSYSNLATSHWWVNNEQYSTPVVDSADSDPLVSIAVPSSWGWPAGTVNLRVAKGVTGAVGSDGTLVIISGGVAYDFWRFVRIDDTHAKASSYGSSNLTTGTGWATLNPTRGAGTSAVGASSLGGLITGTDLKAGVIDHALSVAMQASNLSSSFVSPAIASDGTTGPLPEGTRFGIPAGTAMPAGLSPIGQMVWKALQKYGAYLVNGGGTNVFISDPNSVTPAQINPLRVWWGSNGHSDLDLIMPQVKIVH